MASRPAAWHKPNPKRIVGGYAALANLIAKEKHPTLLLDSGDFFQGTPEGTMTKGKASVALMNQLKYDAVAVGNHEYDLGESVVRDLAAQATFPFLAANIQRKKDKKPVAYAQPTLTRTVGGIRVGIVGLATHETRLTTMPRLVEHLNFTNEVAAAHKHAAQLRRDGAQVVIALTHCGAAASYARKWVHPDDFKPTERDLASIGDIHIARGADVDLVLGGHTHTGLKKLWFDPVSGVPIGQSFENLIAANRIEIQVDPKTGTVQRMEGNLIRLWIDQLGEAQPVLETVDRYRKQVADIVDRRLGVASAAIPHGHDAYDTAMGNWMTDIMRASLDADVAIQNTFGIRDDLDAGDVSLRDLFRIMPFDNTLVRVELSGADLTDWIRQTLRVNRTFLQVSGMQVLFTAAPDGQSVQNVRVQVGGKPVDPKRMYRIATNDYLASGGGAGQFIKGRTQHDTGKSLRAVVADYVQNHTPVSPPTVGRFVLEK